MSKDTRSPFTKALKKFIVDVAVITEGETQRMLANPNEIDLNENLDNYQIYEFDKLIIAAKLEDMFNQLDFDEDVIRQAKTAQDIIDAYIAQEGNDMAVSDETASEEAVGSSENAAEECADVSVNSEPDDASAEEAPKEETPKEEAPEEKAEKPVKKAVKATKKKATKETKKDE